MFFFSEYSTYTLVPYVFVKTDTNSQINSL